jgi:hypothetical protein
MPFSVFGTFTSWLLSWAILGLGIYFAYDAYDRFQSPVLRGESARTTAPDTNPDDRERLGASP